ncbi:MAG TPA: tetratricopeptide repeat protein [Candidatus Sulfotelmatobacter sp.]|nr:tetratricopeptide repeat protein [Candidatus Sulfotelmatobacter sp.]
MARQERRTERASQTFSEAVRLSRKAADPSLLASSLIGLGQTERDLNNNHAALQHYREAVDLLRTEPNRLRLAHTIRHLADILREDGSSKEATICYEEALKVYREDIKTPPLDLANTLRGFALLKGNAGETENAKSLWQEARSLYKSVNVQAGVEESERQIARLTASRLPSGGVQ